jgi:hypothetical protein
LRRKNQAVDVKKEACQKDSRIRGTKEWSREKIPGSGGYCGKKNFRIRQTKEWSREKIPGSGSQCRKKNKQNDVTEKRFQDQAVRIRRHMKRRKDSGLVSCDFLLGSVKVVIGLRGLPHGGRCGCVVGLGVW